MKMISEKNPKQSGGPGFLGLSVNVMGGLCIPSFIYGLIFGPKRGYSPSGGG